MSLCRICPIELKRDVFSKTNDKCLACKYYRTCYDTAEKRDELDVYFKRARRNLQILIKDCDDLKLKGTLYDVLIDLDRIREHRKTIESNYNDFTFVD